MSASERELPEAKLQRSSLSVIDDVGTVFFHGDRVLRAVRAEAVGAVRALLASGLPDALAGRGWMPPCWVADVTIAGFALVIEQARLPVVSYPYEWSYGMLRDAAARVLEINMLARAHGWELKDSHGFNMAFDGPQPMWVDLGSFVPCAREERGWPGLEDFVRFYEYPLRIWSHGGGFMARRLVATRERMSHADYGLYRWPWLRGGKAEFYQRWVRRWYQARRLARTPDEKIRFHFPAAPAKLVCALKTRGWLPGQDVSLERMRNRLLRRVRRGSGGLWSAYQAAGADSVASPRFTTIVKLVRRCQVASIVELGGNQGWLSERLLREGAVQSAICTDADEIAVDRAYERVKAASGRMHTAVLDFVDPMLNPGIVEPPEMRLRADAVLALAVTHHLLLTQRIPIERVLKIIAAYARRVVFVEFMPLGLWDGRTAPPVPPWYTTEWFREAFAREFTIIQEERLEPNRHLFCGARRTSPEYP